MKMIWWMVLSLSTAHAYEQRPMCRMKLEKTTQMEVKNRTAGVQRRGVVARDEFQKRDVTEVSDLIVTSGMATTLTVDASSISVKCTVRPNGSYDLDISRSDSTGGLATSVSLTSGQTIDLGAAVKNLSEENRTVDVPTGIIWGTQVGSSQSQYRLSMP